MILIFCRRRVPPCSDESEALGKIRPSNGQEEDVTRRTTKLLNEGYINVIVCLNLHGGSCRFLRH